MKMQFRTLESNPEFEQLVKELTEFDNNIEKISVMNQLVYDKLQALLKNFDKVKNEYG